MNSITFYKLLFSGCLIYSVIWPSLAELCPPYERPVKCIDQCRSCKWVNKKCAQGAVCYPGCDCFPGWRRDYQNKCIPENQCPGNCGPNSQYSDCASPCPRVCGKANPQGCAAVCVKGCVCNPGYILDGKGNCIPESLCSPGSICGPNSKYSDCASPCPRVCGKANPQGCAAVCVKGCVCNPGYILDGKGNCIPESLCPPGTLPPVPLPVPFPPVPLPPFPFPPSTKQVCPPNEYPVKCVNRCQKCEDRKGGCGQSAICTPGCDCLPNFWRNKQNQCIPEFQCPRICGPNSKYSDCASPCPRVCGKADPRGCAAVCVKGCVCNPGYILDGKGNCIPESLCPPRTLPPVPLPVPLPPFPFPPSTKQVCPPNEYPVKCINRCQKCEDRKPGCAQIALCTPGCDCVPTFWRNKQNQCIPEFQCPPL